MKDELRFGVLTGIPALDKMISLHDEYFQVAKVCVVCHGVPNKGEV